MRLSEKEFQALCAKSPAIAARAPIRKTSTTAKYRNVKVYIYKNGVVSYGGKLEGLGTPIDVFDSTKEYNRWNELLLLERAGKITNLQRQVKMIIQEKTILAGATVKEIAYKADFVYNEENKHIIEDVKPFDDKTKRHRLTKDFTLKWKLLQVKYPQYVFRIH